MMQANEIKTLVMTALTSKPEIKIDAALLTEKLVEILQYSYS
jgi:Na+-translocating ferredoxin:NAD+ oxidoreductase RnfC subunit